MNKIFRDKFYRKERFTCSMYIVLLWKEIKIEQNFFLDILLFSIMTCPVLCFGNLFDLAVSYFAKINPWPTVVNYLHLPVIMPLNVIDAWFSIPYHDPYSSDIDACKSKLVFTTPMFHYKCIWFWKHVYSLWSKC